tara:strand:- start:557 stop:1066 length:510 start_codon:yes stop_codon:yes gene_type:complete
MARICAQKMPPPNEFPCWNALARKWNIILQQSLQHLLAKPSFRPDAKAIANKQHLDQQLGVHGRAPGVAIEIGKIGADTGQIHDPVNRAQEVILRDMILERELIEQRRMPLLPCSHHHQSSHPFAELNQDDALRSSTSFSTQQAQTGLRLRQWLLPSEFNARRFLEYCL